MPPLGTEKDPSAQQTSSHVTDALLAACTGELEQLQKARPDPHWDKEEDAQLLDLWLAVGLEKNGALVP